MAHEGTHSRCIRKSPRSKTAAAVAFLHLSRAAKLVDQRQPTHAVAVEAAIKIDPMLRAAHLGKGMLLVNFGERGGGEILGPSGEHRAGLPMRTRWRAACRFFARRARGGDRRLVWRSTLRQAGSPARDRCVALTSYFVLRSRSADRRWP